MLEAEWLDKRPRIFLSSLIHIAKMPSGNVISVYKSPAHDAEANFCSIDPKLPQSWVSESVP